MVTDTTVRFYVRIIRIYHQQLAENAFISYKCTFLLFFFNHVLVLFGETSFIVVELINQ